MNARASGAGRVRRGLVAAGCVAVVLTVLFVCLSTWEPGEEAIVASPEEATRPRTESGEAVRGFTTDRGGERREVRKGIASPESGRGAPPGKGDLRLLVVEDAPGNPAVPGVDVLAVPNGSFSVLAQGWSGNSDEEGTLVFSGLDGGEWYVEAPVGGQVICSVVPGEVTDATLTLARGDVLRGWVESPGGDPVPGAVIWGLSRFSSSPVAWTLGRADAQGRFEVTVRGRMAEIGGSGVGYGPSRPVRWALDPSAPDDLVLRLTADGARLLGQVVDSAGRSVGDATVEIETDPGFLRASASPWLRSGDAGGIVVRTRSSRAGDFEAVVAPGTVAVLVKAVGRGTSFQRMRLANGETGRMRFVLERGAVLAGVVTKVDGSPAGKVILGVQNSGGALERIAMSAADGRYVAMSLPARTPITVVANGYHQGMDSQVFEAGLASGVETTWNPVLGRRGTIRGHVVLPDEARVEGILVRAEGHAYRRPLPAWTVSTDAAGAFVFENCPFCPYSVEITVPWLSRYRLFSVDGVWPGGGEVTVRVPAGRLPSSRIRCTVANGEGLCPTDCSVLFVRGSQDGSRPEIAFIGERTGLPGVFESPALDGDAYWISASADGYVRAVVGPILLAPQEVVDAGIVDLLRGVEVSFTLPREMEAMDDPVEAAVWDESGRSPLSRSFVPSAVPSVLSLGPLPAGSYVLVLRRPGGGRLHRAVFHVADLPVTVHFEKR